MNTTPPHPPLATRAQRIALLAGLLVAAWLILQLFGSMLLPFVAAAGIAYFLDPLAVRLTRIGVGRSIGAGVLILGLLLAILLFALLLYPVLLAQISLLVNRVPTYVQLVRGFANDTLLSLQDRLGADFVDEKLRDLARLVLP